jgi:hypothetical protein
MRALVERGRYPSNANVTWYLIAIYNIAPLHLLEDDLNTHQAITATCDQRCACHEPHSFHTVILI